MVDARARAGASHVRVVVSECGPETKPPRRRRRRVARPLVASSSSMRAISTRRRALECVCAIPLRGHVRARMGDARAGVVVS